MDSDGCALDSMDPKQRSCFAPALVEVWGLKEFTSLAETCYLQLNLRSVHRGVNRFRALDLFWPRFAALVPTGYLERTLPPLDRFHRWVLRDGPLSEAALADEARRHHDDQGLARALQWSRRVNALSRALPPALAFPGATEALAAAAANGPVHVVSSGNRAVIRDEWRAAGLDGFLAGLHTQESGTKESILRGLAANPGHGDGLMIGDALVDADAARAVGARFFPIVPGCEAESWRTLHREVLPSFFAGRYSDTDSKAWMDRLRAALTAPAAEPAAFA